jgi:hypothetical protein
VHVALPQSLVAVAVTVVVPTGKVEPEAVEYVIVGVGDPVAVAAFAPVKFTTAPHFPASLLTVMLEGHVMVGAEPTVKKPTPEAVSDLDVPALTLNKVVPRGG